MKFTLELAAPPQDLAAIIRDQVLPAIASNPPPDMQTPVRDAAGRYLGYFHFTKGDA